MTSRQAVGRFSTVEVADPAVHGAAVSAGSAQDVGAVLAGRPQNWVLVLPGCLHFFRQPPG
jgi:hypothetical protein